MAVQGATKGELVVDLDCWQLMHFPTAVMCAVCACHNGVKRAHLVRLSSVSRQLPAKLNLPNRAPRCHKASGRRCCSRCPQHFILLPRLYSLAFLSGGKDASIGCLSMVCRR